MSDEINVTHIDSVKDFKDYISQMSSWNRSVKITLFWKKLEGNFPTLTEYHFKKKPKMIGTRIKKYQYICKCRSKGGIYDVIGWYYKKLSYDELVNELIKFFPEKVERIEMRDKFNVYILSEKWREDVLVNMERTIRDI